MCAECFCEFDLNQNAISQPDQVVDTRVLDANKTELKDGDSVSLIKDLKLKGGSGSLKSGLKVKNIRIVQNAIDGHNISCKVDGVGALMLKSEFVRKTS